jgi:hypothetical protein
LSIQIPFSSHGPYKVALIALKGHPKKVYLYSKTAGEEDSWAVRDYHLEEMVRAGDSTLTASAIEDMVEYAEESAYRSVKMLPRWKTDCQAAAERHFGSAHVELAGRNPLVLGRWRRIS